MSLKLPKISTTWALSIVTAFIVFGGVGVVMLTPKSPVTHATVALADSPAVHPSPAFEAEPSTPQNDPPSKEDKTLEENVIAHSAPLTLPENRSEHAEKTQEVTMSVADLTQEKEEAPALVEAVETPPVKIALASEKIVEVKAETTPYYNEVCLEKRGGEMVLPIESPEGFRPFDVYQGDYFPDSIKTQLTVVISELGANPALFEQVKSSFPKEVVCGFLATRSLSQAMNNEARELGHETLLMLPLEPMNYPKSDPGPWALLTNLSPLDNKKRLERHLSQFTGYIAVTPYMGNRFSRVKRDFQPILKEIKRRGLGYFEPRLVRSKAVQWKPTDMPYAKGNYDITRGSSVATIRETLGRVKTDLTNKHSLILTVQADKVSLKEVQKWLPKVLNETISLAPLSAMTE